MSDSDKVRQQTDALLTMYHDYKQVLAEQQQLATELAKAKLRGNSTVAIQKEYDDTTRQLQAVSDAMTFPSPIVWMMYKFEAYADESQSIRTMQDFRTHCSKPGYICTKRFNFVNAELAKRSEKPLSAVDAYGDELLLSEVYAAVRVLESDDVYMRQWNEYEYWQVDGRVAKWENYIEQ